MYFCVTGKAPHCSSCFFVFVSTGSQHLLQPLVHGVQRPDAAAEAVHPGHRPHALLRVCLPQTATIHNELAHFHREQLSLPIKELTGFF